MLLLTMQTALSLSVSVDHCGDSLSDLESLECHVTKSSREGKKNNFAQLS